MATTMNTSNPQGLGYQTGYFSGTPGTPLTQAFFDAAFASRINENKIYRESFHCNVVQECTLETWLSEYMGYETDCYPEYTLLETYGQYNLVKVGATVVIAAYPTVTQLHLDDNSHFVGGAYILPQVGNVIVLTPVQELAKVISINLASAGDSIIGVQLINQSATAQTVTIGDELLVLSGSTIEDCACPTGQFAFPDAPLEQDLAMIEFGDKGSICGDAIHKCQWLKIPFTDDCGNEYTAWYTQALQEMYQRHYQRKYYERLLNPNFGMLPKLRALGLKWTPNSSSEITTDDVRNWKKLLSTMGNPCREFAIFAGTDLYSQWQRMLLAAGVAKLDASQQPLRDCKWIDMNYCGISVEGLTLHIYEECSFSNGKLLGSGTSVLPDSAIIVPMCNRPRCSGRSNGRDDTGSPTDNKMLTTVYFKSAKTGKVWDNVTDSNGVLGPRNTFGTGCETHEWSIKSRFTQELHCIQWWGFMGLS